jgi:adenylate cyclase
MEVIRVLSAQAAISIENARLSERLQNEAVTRNNLLRFFPPRAVSRLITNGEVRLETVTTEVAALFCDISGYTAMCGQMPPREIVELLNAYFGMMAEIVFRHEGMLEKYIGDALLAVWGAPFRDAEDADRATECAIDMQRELLAFNTRSHPGRRLQIHIGIEVGPVAAGNIGSPQYIQYATIGNATNLASRICQAAEAGEILISAGGFARLKRTAHCAREKPPLLVKGRDEPLRVYRIGWQEPDTFERPAATGRDPIDQAKGL